MGKVQRSEGDESLAVEGGSKGKGKDTKEKGNKDKGKGKKGKKGVCYICGSSEHWKRDCPKNDEGKSGGGKKGEKDQAGSSANAVAEDSETGDESLAAEANYVNDPGLWTQTEIFDSGSSRHISPYRSSFVSFEPIKPCPLRAANRQQFNAVGKGDIKLTVPNGSGVSMLHLRNVLYSPEAGYTLVSIGRLDDDGYSTTFSNGRCVIHGRNGECVADIPRNEKGLYKFVRDTREEVNAVDESPTLEALHRRLGHISLSTLQRLSADDLICGIKLPNVKGAKSISCDSCVYGKAIRSPITKMRTSERAKGVGDEVHSDVWGPARTSTKRGKRYYVSFTDDNSRWTHIEPLRRKSDVFGAYKRFEAWLETQFGARIKVLRSDRGGEYTSDEFQAYLKSRGTETRLTVHDTPQHNGVAERRNRTILERVRTLLHSSHLPRNLWAEAANHVVWVMNRTGTRALKKTTPYGILHRRKPNLEGLPEWGSMVWVCYELSN